MGEQDDDDMFGDEELEEGMGGVLHGFYGVGRRVGDGARVDIDGRRVEREESVGYDQGRRLSRELEVGFRDDSSEDEEDTRGRTGRR